MSNKPTIRYVPETSFGIPGTVAADIKVMQFRNAYVPREKASGVSKPNMLKFLRAKRLQAMKNRSRQHIKELHTKPVRVRSAFWDLAVRDYDRAITRVERDKPTATYTVEIGFAKLRR